MPTTTRLGLRKPNGSDIVDRVNDLNNNWDLIDSKIGRVICTSSTRPTGSNLYAGLPIYETDTKNFLTYDGSTWQNELAYNGTAQIVTLGPNVSLGWGNTVVGTNASGDINMVSTILTATGWASVFGFEVFNGDYGARANAVMGANAISFPATSGNVRVYTGNTGAVIASLGVRFQWMAVGK